MKPAPSSGGPEPLEILHLDEHIAVVNKPSGLLVHRSPGWAEDRDTLVDRLRSELRGRVYPAHRLDRATSGALIVARSSDAAARLNLMFRGGEITKLYLALVRGIPPEHGLIDHPIRKGKSAQRIDARTAFRRLHSFERYSLVVVQPLTGRLHQIRRHMKHLSHPLVGDVRYGKGDINRDFRSRFGLHRLALHACALGFRHPHTDQRLWLRAPLPDDLAGPFRAMGIPETIFQLPATPIALENDCPDPAF